MISNGARHGINQIFIKAARSRFARSDDDEFVVEVVGPGDEMPAKARIVVLTIASFEFRLLTLLHIEDTAATRAYFVPEGVDDSLVSAFSERGNLCCGAMNQDLLRYFPDLGMSTPYELNGRCLAFVDVLRPGYLSRFRLTINGNVNLMATICLCEYAPIDFTWQAGAQADVSGELELF